MYSEQLEQFIELILADGEITDKERAVLHKKAAAEGVDADEIDVYVDGKLDMLKKQISCEQGESTPTKSIDESGMNMNILIKQVDEETGSVIYRMREKYPLQGRTRILPYFEGEAVWNNITNLYFTIELVIGNDRQPFCRIRGGFSPALVAWEGEHGLFEEFILRTNCGDFHGVRQEGELFASLIADRKMMQKLFKVKTLERRKYTSSADLGVFKKDGSRHTGPYYYWLELAADETFGDYVRKFYTAINGQTVLDDFVQDDFVQKKESMGGLGSIDDCVRLLDCSPKTLKPTDGGTPFFEQYADEKTGMIVTHWGKSGALIDIGDKVSVRSNGDKLRVSLDIRLHALADKEEKETMYFFDVEKSSFTKCKIKKNGKGEMEKEWEDCEDALGLVSGTLKINIGSEEFLLPPLAPETPMRDDEEYCYYVVEPELMKRLAEIEGFKLSLETEKGTFILEPIGFSKEVALLKKWKLGYKVLSQPDKREQILQEYNDSLFSTKAKKAVGSIFGGLKGMFGKK